jgi:hypothetical protein
VVVPGEVLEELGGYVARQLGEASVLARIGPGVAGSVTQRVELSAHVEHRASGVRASAIRPGHEGALSCAAIVAQQILNLRPLRTVERREPGCKRLGPARREERRPVRERVEELAAQGLRDRVRGDPQAIQRRASGLPRGVVRERPHDRGGRGGCVAPERRQTETIERDVERTLSPDHHCTGMASEPSSSGVGGIE